MDKIAQTLKRILPVFIYKLLSYLYMTMFRAYVNIIVPNISQTKHGFKISAVPGDVTMKYSFYKFGTWEPHVCGFIQQKIKGGNTVLDIGANVGFDTMVMSQLVGQNGKVYSFEPSQRIYKILEKNIYTLNIFDDNIILMNKGVGSKIDSVELYFDDNNFGGSTICHDYGGKHEAIDIVTIDSLVLSKVDFIKIDIEGYEYEALLGMKKTLVENKNVQIIFEWSPHFYEKLSNNGKEYSINILEYLKKLGFSLFELQNNGESRKILDFHKLYFEIGTEFGSHTDIYAKRE